MRLLAVLALAAAAAAAPLALAIRPGPEETFTAVMTGPASGSAPGEFSGTVALNGSAASLSVRGSTWRDGGRLTVPLTLSYAEIPADWADRFREGGRKGPRGVDRLAALERRVGRG
jgi:hypothetical protein